MGASENPYEPLKADVIAKWQNSIDVSESTKKRYAQGLRYFCEYVRACGFDFDELEAEHVKGYKAYLRNERKLSPATVSQYLASVRSFYRFAEDQGLENIARNVRGEKSPRGFKKDSLSLSQAHELLESIPRDTLSGKRDYAIINLMMRTGVRDIEVSRANIEDLRSNGEDMLLFVQGKGRAEKDSFVVVLEPAHSPIKEYLAERTRLRGKPRGHEPLFASESNFNKGGRLNPMSVSQIIKAALREIGLDSDRYTAHSLRHTAITFSLEGGATERQAQEMARHADISTTMLYAHRIDRISNAAERNASQYLDGWHTRRHPSEEHAF